MIANKFIVVLLSILSGFGAAGADTMPYHPFRQIGTNHYDLRSLYAWRLNLQAKAAADNAATRASIQAGSDAAFRTDLNRNATAAAANAAAARSSKASAEYQVAKQACPLPAWAPTGAFTVREVWKADLLLLESPGGSIVLKNHPTHGHVVDGQPVQFFALRTGSYQWTDAAGAVHTLPLYDYGIPYAPTNAARATQGRP